MLITNKEEESLVKCHVPNLINAINQPDIK